MKTGGFIETPYLVNTGKPGHTPGFGFYKRPDTNDHAGA